jgi:gliding motility-associated-like protein
VLVYDAPVADFSATDVCLNTATDFTNNSSSAGDSITLYLWSLGDGNSRKDTGDFSYTYQTDGIFNVELYVQTIRGCNASISKNVEIFPLPQVSIETLDLDGLPASPEIIPGDSLELRINGNYAAISWVGQSSSSNAIRIGDAGTYQVLVTSADGCSVNDEITITELSIPELVIRDVITPNGDLVNDELFVENLNYYAPLKIKFYHSSGAEIYSSEDYKNDWRPEYNSTLLTEGVYFYYAEDKLGNIYKGTISIVK